MNVAFFHLFADLRSHANHLPADYKPATIPQAPSLMSPASRTATPRDSVTPFTSERDYGALANGSTVFGNMTTGGWNFVSELFLQDSFPWHKIRSFTAWKELALLFQQTTLGDAYRCLGYGYVAPSYDLLGRRHDMSDRTNYLTEL